ncbi:trypsin-like serine peptidase [Chondromyces crocatus]|uniref:Serine protease n=1 Tax=Chondromyces crocatus TaxID=52 RepID=A0A0K1EKC7_CHOCO|nr:serine protease [Chondromyces crocatus]AKT41117.1 uncharacterized protein CMC5_052780 [Chondromyces crocatus]
MRKRPLALMAACSLSASLLGCAVDGAADSENDLSPAQDPTEMSTDLVGVHVAASSTSSDPDAEGTDGVDLDDPQRPWGPNADAANRVLETEDLEAYAAEMGIKLGDGPDMTTKALCNGDDNLTFVNDFTGKHGISSRFVQREKIPVGIIRPIGCSGTLIAHDLFLTNAHCVPEDGAQVLAQTVQFGFEEDGELLESLPSQSFPVVNLLELRNQNLDYAIYRLGHLPGLIYGHNTVASGDPPSGSVISIIGHPAFRRKQVDVGHARYNVFLDRILYDDLDTLGGNSGSGILNAQGELTGLHYGGSCDGWFGYNYGEKMSNLLQASPLLRNTPRQLILSQGTDPTLYVIHGGARLAIASMDEFNALGFRAQDHRVLPPGALSSTPTVPRDGTVLVTPGGARHVVFGGARFPIHLLMEFTALGYSNPDMNPAPQLATQAIPLIPRDGTLLQERSHDPVYVVLGGIRYWIQNWTVFHARGYQKNRIRIIPDGSVAQIPFGGVLTS